MPTKELGTCAFCPDRADMIVAGKQPGETLRVCAWHIDDYREQPGGPNMKTNATDHDVNALVDLATKHADQWGDSCHHALAGEIVRLRERAAATRRLLNAAVALNKALHEQQHYSPTDKVVSTNLELREAIAQVQAIL